MNSAVSELTRHARAAIKSGMVAATHNRAPEAPREALRYRAPWRRNEPADGYMPQRSTDAPEREMTSEIRPGSWDPETRTIEIVWTTGARVLREDWWTGELWYEELSTDPAHVRLDRLNNGAPFLDAHMGWSNRTVIGVHVDGSARMEGGQGLAKVRFSKAASKAEIVDDIVDGIIRHVSTGYTVYRWEEVGVVIDGEYHAGRKRDPRNAAEIPVFRAVDWEPAENSAVPMPADPLAGFRSASNARQEAPVKNATRKRAEDDETCPECEGKDDCTCDDADGDEDAQDAQAAQRNAEIARAAEQAILKERARITAVRGICLARSKRGGYMLPEDTAKRLADEAESKGWSVETTRAKVFEALRDADDVGAGGGHVRVSAGDQDETKTRAAGMVGAILYRTNADAFPVDDNARRFVGMRLTDMAAMALRANGINTEFMSPTDIARRALSTRTGTLTSADFPLILQDAGGKLLRKGYDLSQRTWLPFCRRTTAANFKPIKAILLGEAPKLLQVNEAGEYQPGSMVESQETYRVVRYGRLVPITWEMIVDDDLGAFAGALFAMGMQGGQLESDIIYGLITANPSLSDGAPVYNASSGTLIETPGQPADRRGLKAMRHKIRTQKGLDGTSHLQLAMRYIVGPSALEDDFDVLVSERFVANDPNKAVSERMRQLIPITDTRLDDASETAFYGFADPALADTIHYAYLAGEEGVHLDSEADFRTDGLTLKVRHHFGAGWVDRRGTVKNDWDGLEPSNEPSEE